MKRTKLLFAIGSFFLAGYSANGAAGTFADALQNSFNKALQKNHLTPQENTGEQSENGGASYQRLVDTKLKDIFKNFPVRDDGNPPAFPKVAIRVTGYSKTLEFPQMMTKAPNECVNYSITLWMNARKSEHFENLKMCAPDIVFGTSFLTVRSSWPAKLNFNKNSAQVRDDGPIAPKAPYPGGNPAQNFMMGDGVYFVGSMFVQLGYDWIYPHDTMRVWITSVSK